VAGALDHRPEGTRLCRKRLGVAADRAYGDWREMLEGENRDDRVDLVTVATPNSTHFEITKAFLEAGFHVLCEKPMTMTVEEGEDIVRTARASGRICAVNYCYTGLSDGAHMRQMVRGTRSGRSASLARISAMATTAMRPMPTIRACAGATIRRMAGVSGQFADCGIHALHMASFIVGEEVEKALRRLRLDDPLPDAGG
jgi:predicted dehydrogenase